MTGVKRLLYAPQSMVTPDFLDRIGFKAFCKTDPVAVSPIAWREEDGVTGYGYLLEGLMLDDLETLNVLDNTTKISVLSFDKIKDSNKKLVEPSVEKVLSSIGMRINSLKRKNTIPGNPVK